MVYRSAFLNTKLLCEHMPRLTVKSRTFGSNNYLNWHPCLMSEGVNCHPAAIYGPKSPQNQALYCETCHPDTENAYIIKTFHSKLVYILVAQAEYFQQQVNCPIVIHSLHLHLWKLNWCLCLCGLCLLFATRRGCAVKDNFFKHVSHKNRHCTHMWYSNVPWPWTRGEKCVSKRHHIMRHTEHYFVFVFLFLTSSWCRPIDILAVT